MLCRAASLNPRGTTRSKGDRSGFRRSLEALVADERGRQHHVVARQLEEFLTEPDPAPPRAISAPPDTLVDELHPQRMLDELVLAPNVRALCDQLLEEQHRADILRSHGLEPRHRVLLLGPPGNGKTSLAEAIAGELALPLLRVRYDTIVGSFLGETAARLGKVFDHARTRQCVLFFDEFDSIGKSRGDSHETGEIKRLVNTLLLRIDSLPSYVVVIAATNHPELLDRAVWRRFQIRAELNPPRPSDALKWVRRFEESVSISTSLADKTLLNALAGSSYADLEEFCRDMQRRVVLAGPDADVRAISRTALAQLREQALTASCRSACVA